MEGFRTRKKANMSDLGDTPVPKINLSISQIKFSVSLHP